MAQRLLGNNFMKESEILLSVSSQEPLLPKEFVLDQVKTKVWRTLLGWTIVEGFNDRIDWTRGAAGPFVATLTPGTYATGALLAAQIETKMEAADAVQPFYTVLYNTSTHKFSIAHASGLNTLLNWDSGPNSDRSFGADLGFRAENDSDSEVTHTGTYTSYQSRHYLVIARSDGAVMEATAVALVSHNVQLDPATSFSAAQTILVQASDSEDFDNPILSQDMEVSSLLDPCVAYIVSLSGARDRTHWRLLINAVQNPDGYFELGHLYLGTYEQPVSKVQSVSLSNDPEDFSDVVVAIDGTHYVDQRRSRGQWSILWKLAGVADTALLRAFFGELTVGENFILQLLHDDLSSAKYGCFFTRPKEQHVSTLVVNFTFVFVEAL